MKFTCPHCEQRVEAPDELLGQTVPCPTCGGDLALPAAAPAAPARSERPRPGPPRPGVPRRGAGPGPRASAPPAPSAPSRRRAGGIGKILALLVVAGLAAAGYHFRDQLAPEVRRVLVEAGLIAAAQPAPLPAAVSAPAAVSPAAPTAPTAQATAAAPTEPAAPAPAAAEPGAEPPPAFTTAEPAPAPASAPAAPAEATSLLDALVFGDPASEKAHNLSAPETEVLTGGLGQPARRMRWNPADTTTREGGHLNFTMKCDPLNLNYVTLKVWGSDTSHSASGALVLYQIEDKQLLQVGDRVVHFREFPPLAWAVRSEAAIPDRFYYTTVPLPLSLTQGRDGIELRLVAVDMNARGSLPVYRAYVHRGAYFQPGPGDVQGAPPAPAPIRPASGVTLEAAFAKAKAQTIADMTAWLQNNGGNLDALLAGYSLPWTPAYKNATLPPRVVENVDKAARGYFANPKQSQGWGGKWGPEGERIAKIGAAGFGPALDEVVDLGDPAGPAKRRVLWAKMLRASVDWGRFHRRGPTTNQTIINDNDLAKAQRGLVALKAPEALPDAHVRRFLYESMGLLPWLGPDRVEGGRNSFVGTDYFLVSPAGLTKENGYVSAYGEVYDVSAHFYAMTGDERLRVRAAEMLRARSHFRYPMVDEDGYRSFRMIGPLDWRTHQYFPFDQAYGERGTRLVIAPLTKDPDAVGSMHQMFKDNQGPAWGADLSTALLLENILKLPDNGRRLPMTEGQPDYAWADVDNGIVAIKRGENLTWIEPYWQARQGLHSMGRTFEITPTAARLGLVRSDLQFDWSGVWSAKANRVMWNNDPLSTPSGLVQQAYLGDKTLQARGPGGITREEFIGRASFYATRYGRYLVGINMDKKRSYLLKTPAGFRSAPDLITKTVKTGPVTVPPVTAVVLDLGTTDETGMPPHAPKFVEAAGVAGGVLVTWETAPGAVNYTLQRATAPGGPYLAAPGLGANYPKKWGSWPTGAYLDTTATAGKTYYYRVVGLNAAGEGYPSPESPGATPAAAIPSADKLPAPWKNVNFAGNGVTRLADGVFTLRGGGGDIWREADGGQFVYQLLVGDGDLVARLTAPGAARKVGLMIRGAAEPGAAQASMLREGDRFGGIQRGRAGGGSGNFGLGASAPGAGPAWLKLERRGKRVAFSWAPDASGQPGSWTEIGAATPDLGPAACVGFVTTDGAPTFDRVALASANRLVATPPPAPAGLTATAENGRVILGWLPADGAATYNVRRAATAAGPFTTIAGADLAALGFTDAPVTAGTPYFYVVTGKNSAGEGPPSAPVSATPSALAPPAGLAVAVRGTQATLTWTATPGAASYDVRRSLDGVTWTPVQEKVTATQATDAALAPGGSYLYTVAANGAAASGPASAAVAASAVPLAPGSVEAVGRGSEVRLRWRPVANATGYRVQRAAGGSVVPLAKDLLAPIFTDPRATPGSDALYTVTAANAAGESPLPPAARAGWGTGLLAEFFNNTDAKGEPVGRQLDPNAANADWGGGSPLEGVNNDRFSVVWTGQLEAPATDTYTFEIADLDDGFRLEIDGAKLLDNAGPRKATVDLKAGQKYPIRAHFWDGTGAAKVIVKWSTPSMPPQVLPASRLYPPDPR